MFFKKNQPEKIKTKIEQTSNVAVIDFQSFQCGRLNEINIILPTPNSSILINDMSGKRTKIDGSINCNGNLFISNPAGILTSKKAHIKAKNLVLTTSTCSSVDFSNQHFKFSGPQKSGPLYGLLVSTGKITVDKNGSAYFLLKDPVKHTNRDGNTLDSSVSAYIEFYFSNNGKLIAKT